MAKQEEKVIEVFMISKGRDPVSRVLYVFLTQEELTEAVQQGRVNVDTWTRSQYMSKIDAHHWRIALGQEPTPRRIVDFNALFEEFMKRWKAAYHPMEWYDEPHVRDFVVWCSLWQDAEERKRQCMEETTNG